MKRNLKKIGLGVLAAAVCTTTAAVGISQYGKFGKTDKTTVVEETVNKTGNIVMHFKWTGEDTPHLYYSNVNHTGGTNMSYPGVPMQSEGKGWYSYAISDADCADLVISVPNKGYETNTFERTSGEYWYDDGRGWFTENPDEDIMAADKKTGIAKKEDGVVAVDSDASQVDAGDGITIHYKSEWGKANIYYWNALPEDMVTSWPGEEVKKDEDGYYTYTFQGVDKINFLFTNGSQQTNDFTRTTGEWWYDAKKKKWVNKKPSEGTGDVTTLERGDFREETIYFIMTSRFYDGDSSNNCVSWRDTGTDDNNSNPKNPNPVWRGDFKGIVEKLDYIKALGFSAIWITPVVKNASDYDYHGYHAINHSVVDVRNESDDCSYQDLINACHEKGIRVIQDIVLNHCSDYGEENLFPAYTRTDDISKLDRSDTAMTVTDLGRKIGMSEETTRNEAKRCATLKSDENDPEFIFHHEKNCQWEGYTVQTGQMGAHCVDLNTENPKVCHYLNDCYTNYINMGVDAFRIDTVKHVARLAFNKEFLPAFREAGGENFFMFGEACVLRNEVFNAEIPGISACFYTWTKGDDAYGWQKEETLSATKSNMALVKKHFEDNTVGNQPTSTNAFLNGNEYHKPDYSEASGMNMIDFYMHHKFGDAGSAFGVAKEEDPYFNDSTWNVMYVDSHDYGPNEGGSLYTRYTGSQANWAENLDLIFSFRGIPCIYYGSEIEFMKGAKIDDWHNPVDKSGRAYFGDEITGSVNTTDYAEYSGATGAMADALNYPLAQHIQRLNKIRRAIPALQKGQYSTEGCSGNLSYKRRYTDGDTDSFVCVTISGDSTFSGVPAGTYVDVVTGDVQQCSGTLTAKCSGQGNMRVYVLQTDGAPDGKIGEAGTYLK